ncbi:MAG: C39 family peptidase [Patescibacteria group bacterium]
MLKKIILPIAIILFLCGCLNKTAAVRVEAVDESSSPAINMTTTAESIATVATSDQAIIAKPKAKNVSTSSSTSTKPVKKSFMVPEKLELPVAFSQQAPFANWDVVHEETCEEASMIMSARYFNQQKLDEQIMEQELQKLLKWEADRGYEADLTADQTAKILQNYFDLRARVSTIVTVDQIRYELANNNLILVPAAGRELNNPNFKRPGPIYHMLIVKGYNDSEFITNDPGTRKGNGWRYKQEQFLQAIHGWGNDWVKDSVTEEKMESGAKEIIIVSK